MEPLPFLGLEATDDPHRWRLPVAPHLCTGHGFLFGGCGLGAAIEALERTTGRPVIWATAQYLAYANPPSVMDIDVTVPVSGKTVSQARAVAQVGDTEILTVNAALGHRDLEHRGQFQAMPDVPGPEDCPFRPSRFDADRDTIMRRIELRLARGRQFEEFDGTPRDDGRSALWARMADLPETTAAKLAVLGDYVPFGTSQALGRPVGGNSLDNTLRVVRLVPTEWVLLDIRVHAVERGFGHGLVHLWAQDGTLLATASQSIIARAWD
ncbi:MAG TPA: acyl-CoA thioesterase domain-containing protein [Acidimicrobiales bacterium]|nr:acyl-CoA thioesterase domain-containing protein [Acidimicrobiales bacterium]